MSVAHIMMERRAALAKQAQDLAQLAVAEGRDLTGEEAATFDRLMGEIDSIAARAQQIVEGEQRARDIEESFRKGAPVLRGPSSDTSFGTWARSARVGDAFDIAPEVGAERRALAAYQQRAMSADGTGTKGVYSQLWEYAVAGSQILQAGAQVINTTDGNALPLPVVTAHATGASAAINAAITASDAGLTTVSLAVIKRGYLTLVPTELVQDATFDLEGYLTRAAGRELGKIINTVAAGAVTGGFTVTGVMGPTGTASGTLGSVTAAGQGGDLLISLFHSVLPEYRANGAWLMNDSVAALIRKLKATDGQYVWERSLQLGTPAMIDGRPVYTDPNLPSFVGTPATDSTKKIVYFGDFSALKVRIAGGLRFERSNDYAFGNDQVAYRALVRCGAAVVDTNAVKFLQLS